MTEHEINELLPKYHAGKCMPEELAFINSWYNDHEGKLPEPGAIENWDEVQAAIWSELNEIEQLQPVVKSVPIYQKYRIIGAASALLLIIGAAYFMLQPGKKEKIQTATTVQDAAPGTNKATLTLANGQQIFLDAAKAGTLAQQAGVTVSKNASGQLVYSTIDAGANGGAAFNTISTPSGGQYEVYLPDGSHVYLNAASSLKYPVKFIGSTRTVILNGEAYFEVKKNIDQPFIVSSIGQSVKVLGTHFNVTSYQDESIVTSLAEGKIELSSTSFPQKTILQPGNQSTALPDRFRVTKVKISEIAAWKDGLFKFNNTELKDALRQMARWYDVSVDSAIPNIKISGEIPRKANLLKVLAQIEAVSDVQLKLQERRIMLK